MAVLVFTATVLHTHHSSGVIPVIEGCLRSPEDVASEWIEEQERHLGGRDTRAERRRIGVLARLRDGGREGCLSREDIMVYLKNKR